MKTGFLLTILLIQPLIFAHGQIIKVIDKEDQNPVADVAIISEINTKFACTSRSGNETE